MRKLRWLVLFAALLVMATGCFGRFGLTRKVYAFNEDFGNKFVQTAVMWCMLIIPVYEVVGFVDFVFLNTVEFWTGTNPVASLEVEHKSAELADGRTVEMTMDREARTMELTVYDPQAGPPMHLLVRPEGEGFVLVHELTDTVLLSVDPRGTITRPNGQMVAHLDPETLEPR